jgi:chemotaxis regulatin CheY-phosphate phosphatase CheZ
VLPMLPALFVRAMGEVQAMLESIRTGRESIRAAAGEKLAHTNEKLGEVSSATAHAALDIMDALDRAIAKVDELETDDVLADADKGTAIRAELRDELFAVMGHMQFQDITSQQIMHVQSLLGDMESRLSEVATLFDHQSGNPPTETVTVTTKVDRDMFDPNATLADAESRQALADALVVRGTVAN